MIMLDVRPFLLVIFPRKGISGNLLCSSQEIKDFSEISNNYFRRNSILCNVEIFDIT
jgi:hypothetical protein